MIKSTSLPRNKDSDNVARNQISDYGGPVGGIDKKMLNFYQLSGIPELTDFE